MDEQQTSHVSRGAQRPFVIAEASDLIRIDIPDVESRAPDGTTSRGTLRQFLGLPSYAETFGTDILRRCLHEWDEVAALVGMQRSALIALATALRPDEERSVTPTP